MQDEFAGEVDPVRDPPSDNVGVATATLGRPDANGVDDF